MADFDIATFASPTPAALDAAAGDFNTNTLDTLSSPPTATSFDPFLDPVFTNASASPESFILSPFSPSAPPSLEFPGAEQTVWESYSPASEFDMAMSMLPPSMDNTATAAVTTDPPAFPAVSVSSPTAAEIKPEQHPFSSTNTPPPALITTTTPPPTTAAPSTPQSSSNDFNLDALLIPIDYSSPSDDGNSINHIDIKIEPPSSNVSPPKTPKSMGNANEMMMYTPRYIPPFDFGMDAMGVEYSIPSLMDLSSGGTRTSKTNTQFGDVPATTTTTPAIRMTNANMGMNMAVPSPVPVKPDSPPSCPATLASSTTPIASTATSTSSTTAPSLSSSASPSPSSSSRTAKPRRTNPNKTSKFLPGTIPSGNTHASRYLGYVTKYRELPLSRKATESGEHALTRAAQPRLCFFCRYLRKLGNGAGNTGAEGESPSGSEHEHEHEHEHEESGGSVTRSSRRRSHSRGSPSPGRHHRRSHSHGNCSGGLGAEDHEEEARVLLEKARLHPQGPRDGHVRRTTFECRACRYPLCKEFCFKAFHES